MAKKVKLTATQKAYRKEIARVKRAITRLEKRGYILDRGVIPKELKRPTARSIEKAKKVTTKTLYKRALYYDKETGETLTGVEGRSLERKRSAQKGQETRRRKREQREQRDYGTLEENKGRIVYNNILRALGAPVNKSRSSYAVLISEKSVEKLINVLKLNADILGKEQYGRMLMNFQEEIYGEISSIINDSDPIIISVSTKRLYIIFSLGEATNQDIEDLTAWDSEMEEWKNWDVDED